MAEKHLGTNLESTLRIKVISVTLNVAWLLVPYRHQKLLIYWDFQTQPTLGFTEKGEKIPREQQLMPDVKKKKERE